jgi:hypothetical protein
MGYMGCLFIGKGIKGDERLRLDVKVKGKWLKGSYDYVASDF